MAETNIRAPVAELEDLTAKIARMGGLAESQLTDCLEAALRRDSDLAQKVISRDVAIDALEQEVEEDCVRLLALRHPMAGDLRAVVAAMKISIDLERIGDLSKNVSKRTLVLNREEPVKLIQGLGRMGRQALAQLKEVLDAYSLGEPDRAVAVWRRDEEIDELYNSLFREFLTYMMEDPRTIGLCTHLLFIAKNIERIGDHATNIAEIVYFCHKGRHISEARPKGDVTSVMRIESEPGESS
ncbi:MAG: phosphate signaling complex protein PhoU [Alphaproteobacteria bacterium]|nr:phosphate signaling complex protein PhoU [Alphaproteobacteria bacterium]